MSNKEFEDISIPKWKLTQQGENTAVYRVYSSATEFVIVEADSATEAIVKSNIAKVIMIKSGSHDELTMIDKSMLFADISKAAIMEMAESPVALPAEAPSSSI